MPATTNKQRLLTQLFSAFKKDAEPSEPEALPVLEQFIYGLCREGATRDQADHAFRTLHERFFDWNEARVSSARELEDAFAGLPVAELRAERLISFLQEVFETTFSFDLEWLHKKGLKQAAKQLLRYQAANDYVVSWVVQRTLGGHAIPLDPPTLRTVQRLGLIEDGQNDAEAVRASLEHLIPKVRGPQFSDVVSFLANEACWEGEPHCAVCPMASECPLGQEACAEPEGAARGAPAGRSRGKSWRAAGRKPAGNTATSLGERRGVSPPVQPKPAG